jgi:hypothetical protein
MKNVHDLFVALQTHDTEYKHRQETVCCVWTNSADSAMEVHSASGSGDTEQT